jgi:hypothetical protein
MTEYLRSGGKVVGRYIDSRGRQRRGRQGKAMDDEVYEVLALEGAVPNEDGTYVKFTFRMKDGPSLSLAIPSEKLFPFAALSFVAANQVCAIVGTLANQQILEAEAVEVYPGAGNFDLHFRLAGTQTDIPISITRQRAETLLQELSASLGPASGHSTTRQ